MHTAGPIKGLCMRVRTLSIGCLSFIGIMTAIIAVLAMLYPMAFGFFGAMFIGLTEIGLKEAPFKPRDAVVQSYETQCAPTPFLISVAQPKCRINGQDGAMLKMVTLTYDTGNGQKRTGTTHLDRSWGEPPIGSHVTIRVSVLDSSKFKLKRRGWVNPGWCGNGVCY